MLKIIIFRDHISNTNLILNKYKIKCTSDTDFYVGDESFTCRFLYFKNNKLYAFINILNNTAGFDLKETLESKNVSVKFFPITKTKIKNNKFYIAGIHASLTNVDIC